jgi:hypothetical protein
MGDFREILNFYTDTDVFISDRDGVLVKATPAALDIMNSKMVKDMRARLALPPDFPIPVYEHRGWLLRNSGDVFDSEYHSNEAMWEAFIDTLHNGSFRYAEGIDTENASKVFEKLRRKQKVIVVTARPEYARGQIVERDRELGLSYDGLFIIPPERSHLKEKFIKNSCGIIEDSLNTLSIADRYSVPGICMAHPTNGYGWGDELLLATEALPHVRKLDEEIEGVIDNPSLTELERELQLHSLDCARHNYLGKMAEGFAYRLLPTEDQELIQSQLDSMGARRYNPTAMDWKEVGEILGV